MPACPKPIPRALERAENKRKAEEHRKEIKALVWKRDEGKCRVCGGPATEMHELRFRSLGGQRSTENSIAVCTGMAGGKNCHRYLQSHAIEVEGTNANRRLIFRWNLPPDVKPPHRIRSKRWSQNRED